MRLASSKSGTSNVNPDGGFRPPLWWLAVVVAAGTLLTLDALRRETDWMRETFLNRARFVAAGLPESYVRALSRSSADATKPEYARLKGWLQAIRHDFPDCRFVYLLGRNAQGEMVFLADSEPTGAPDESPPGDVFHEADAAVDQALGDGVAALVAPASDRWGVWASAYAPVADSRTGTTTVLLGMDIDMRDWTHQRFRALRPPIGLTLSLVALLLLARWATGPIRRHRYVNALPGLRQMELVLIVTVGLLATGYAALHAQQQAQRQAQRIFLQLADSELSRFQNRLEHIERFSLPSFARFFEASDEVAQAEFLHFARDLGGATETGIWAWAPKVPQQARRAFEAEHARGDISPAHIWERDAQGARVPAGEREAYYPLQFFSVDMNAYASALGFDLGSEPRRKAAIASASETGLPTATDPVSLNPFPAERTDWILLLQPVKPLQSTSQIAGFVIKSLNLDALMRGLHNRSHLHFRFSQIDPEGADRELASTFPPAGSPRPGMSPPRHLTFCGRVYRVDVAPHAAFGIAYAKRAGLAALLTGALATAALGLGIGMPLRRRQRLEAMVTQRTRELHDSQTRYETLARQSRAFVWEADAQGRFAYLSPLVEPVLGYKPEDMLGRHFYTFAPEADRHIPKRDYLESIREKKPIRNFENRMVTRDGRTVWMLTSGVPLLNAQGEAIGFQGTDTDITERKTAELDRERLLREAEAARQVLQGVIADQKRAEQALRQRDTLLQAASQAAEALLTEPRIDVSVNRALALVGEAVKQDRAYLLECRPAPDDGDVLMDQRYEWCREGVAPQIDNPQLQGMSLRHDCPGWIAKLQAGHAVQGTVRDFSSREQQALQAQGIVSLLGVPIRIDGVLWGMLGFDNCRQDRRYSEAELAVMATIATTIGASLKRHQTLCALHESENRFKFLLENLDHIPVQGYDAQRRVIYWNPASIDVYGYTAEEALGRKIEDLIIPESIRQEVIADTDRWMREGKRTPAGELILRDKQGRDVPVYSTHVAHVTAAGEHELYCVDIDLRRLRAAETRLFETLTRHQALLDANPDIMLMFDRDGGIVDYHAGTPKMLYKPPAEFIGRNVLDVMPAPIGVETRRQITTVFNTGQMQNFAYSLEIDGETRYYGARLVNCGGDRVLAVIRDVTRDREREAQLQQSQKMESVGRLAGGVAHDFNNLLMVQLNSCDFIRQSLPADHPALSDLEQVKACAERAAALTRQLLAFSRKQKLKPEILELNACVANLEKLLTRVISENITLTVTPAPTALYLKADPSQIEQLILNLAVNARDAMPRGGQLTLTTASVTLTRDKLKADPDLTPGPYVLLEVADTGTGMDAKTLSHLFEPFFTTKRPEQGTGLGLSTVYGIVKQSGGTIQVESAPGQGSTFRVYLPAVAPDTTETQPAPTPATSTPPTPERRGAWILVAEDEQTLRRLCERILTRMGYRVTTVASGMEALTVFQKAGPRPDLLLTDVVMPGMSGRELADQLKRTIPNLKVLYMSGYTENAIVHDGVLDPGTPLLQKPFTNQQLGKAIRDLLD